MRCHRLLFLLGVLACGCTPENSTVAPIVTPASKSPPDPLRIVALDKAPVEYLDMHFALSNPALPQWDATIERLKTDGNAYTLHVVDSLRAKELSTSQSQSLVELAERIRESQQARSVTPSDALRLLEIACYADVTCHHIEYPLRIWTLEHVGQYAAQPEIRHELQRISTSYESAFKEELLRDAMNLRMKEYATGLLETPPVTQQ